VTIGLCFETTRTWISSIPDGVIVSRISSPWAAAASLVLAADKSPETGCVAFRGSLGDENLSFLHENQLVVEPQFALTVRLVYGPNALAGGGFSEREVALMK
jgi:hypothetical protein